MARGERVARGYVSAVLLAQAIVALGSGTGPAWSALLTVAAGLVLWLPVALESASVPLRAWSVVPAVLASLVWAAHSRPLGVVGWAAWAFVTVWVCAPAGPGSPATLAETYHPRALESRTGEHRHP